MNRRDFLFSASALAASSVVPEISNAADEAAEKPDYPGLSILQGLTTETTTQLSICVGKKDKVYYSLTDTQTGRLIEPHSVTPAIYESSGTRCDKVKFRDLELGHEYKLLCLDEKKKILDERYLSPVDLNKHGARVGVVSCMMDLSGKKEEMWASAEASNVDYFFFVGDWCYGDFWIFRGPSMLWSRSVQTRNRLPFYFWKKLKPVLAIWDDHDFGKNDSDGDWKHKDYAYHFFQAFFAQEPEAPALYRGYGNSNYFQAFNQNFVFFDGRYYRGIENALGQKGFFGIEQIDWMTEAVTPRPKPTMILTGSPFYGRVEKGASYHFHAAEEMDYFLKKVASWNSPTIFVAGDLHFSEVSNVPKNQLGYETVEIISSCMHSTTKKKFYDNPNKRTQGYLKENFIVLEQVGGRFDPIWRMTCVAEKKTIAFQDIVQI